jgi:predicted DNA-binding WGR domain protein
MNQTQGGPGTNQYGVRGQAKSKVSIVPQGPDVLAITSAPTATKPKPNRSSSIKVMAWELLFQEGTSNKFYRFIQNGKKVVMSWGRVGTVGQCQVFEFSSDYQAADKMSEKTREKMKKGYRVTRNPGLLYVDPGAWFQLTPDTNKNKEALSTLQESFDFPSEDVKIAHSPYDFDRASRQAANFELPLHVQAMWSLAE